MSHRHVPLVPALSGVAAIVFLFAGQAFGGSSPDLTASRAKLASWVAAQHNDAASYAGGVVELFGILTLIVFAATLWSVLRTGDSEDGIAAATAFGAGLASATVKLASVPAAFAATWRHGLSPQLAAALIDMNNVAFVLTWTLDAVMFAAAATVIFRRAVLPRWLGWLGAVTALLLIVSAPAADVVPPLGMLLGFVWIVATSVVLTRRTLRPRPVLAPASA
ncbi:MAG TPA: DUF4386 family protein [Gaiellaceae bacterium]|jgi:hypothetical protein|nr:DUF4386 family protein [Gaiellaceae bacterium]